MKHKRISEFAESIGVSHTAVRRAIDTGRIPASLIGHKQLSTGRKVTIITNPAAARSAFLGSDASAAESGAHAPSAPSVDDADETIPSIAKSRQVTEAYKAKLARLEYEERAGKLVDAEACLLKYTAAVTAARTKFFSIPSKAKGRIPHLTVDEIAILNALIREALEDVAGNVHDRMKAFLESIQEQWRPLVDYTPALTEEKP
jgi:phage terminase Nu1 subunit (DNA packaging protein)